MPTQGRDGRGAAVEESGSPSSTPPLSLPPTVSLYSLCLSSVEVIFALLEFLLAMSVTRELLNSAYRALHPASADSGIPHYNAFVMHVAVNITVFMLVLWRLAQRLRLPVTELLQRLGLTLPQLLSASTFSRMTLAVIVLHSLGFAGMILSQRLYNAGGSIFSLSNYYHKDSEELDWNMISDMLLLAPIREELVFRAVIYCLFYIRLGDDSPSSKLLCAALTGSVFGSVHLMNLLGVRYQPLYIALQVGLGALLGCFYSLRFALTDTLWQSVVMHAANNLYSSFVPLDAQLDLTSPLIAIPLMQTIAVYALLTAISAQQIRQQGDRPFKPLIATPLLQQSETQDASVSQHQEVEEVKETPAHNARAAVEHSGDARRRRR